MDRPKIWTRNFTLLTLANMFYVFGFYMLMPTIPLFVQAAGGSKAQVGVVAASFTIAAIVMRLFSPFILSKLGKRRMLRLGLILSVAVTASCALTSTVPGVLVFRILQGWGFGMVSTMAAAMAADLLPGSRRGEGIGYFGMGTTAMVAVSPALGLFVVNSFGFGSMFLVASAGQTLSLVFLFFFRPPREMIEPQRGTGSKLPFLKSIFDARLALQCVLLALFGMCRSTEQNFLPLIGNERGIELYWYYIFQTIITFAGKYITGKMYDRKGHIWAIVPGAISFFIALIVMSRANTLGAMLIAGFFSGIGLGSLLPAIQVWILTAVDAERRSVASASYYNFYDIGISMGSIFLGMIAGSAGYIPVFRTASSGMAVFLVVYLVSQLKKRNKIRR